MANIDLTLDLKAKKLYDSDKKMEYDFTKWKYDFRNKIFDLDNLAITYDLISDFIFERKIETDMADVKIEDGEVFKAYIYNDYDEELDLDFREKVEEFISDKDLADGDYSVKYVYWYDFSEDEFVVEVQEVYES